ncbi:hypothetical protein H696_05292 [Fonticula alba]|uniref:EGF-like domain-containing protein n=1 Tax=Fonticula alba TaxID=691883 RepID=A0A058Z4C8_FONAL|nr:hypothetical protein H696_05292 [Fonticula alba]KCV68377.1 hypothetical protein H696_05292 [Fonticula alba]|eukprot:XP_009497431.1 hypothetical protein H696_05292 [Fonticula alba]
MLFPLVLLLLLVATTSRGETILLREARYPFTQGFLPDSFSTGPGSPSMGHRRVGTTKITTMTQENFQSSVNEFRWGAFFLDSTRTAIREGPGDPSAASLLILPQGNNLLPLMVETTPSTVKFFTSAVAHPFPSPMTDILTGTALPNGDVLLLGLVGPSDQGRSIFLAKLTAAGLVDLGANIGDVMGPALGAPGGGSSLYMAHGSQIRYMHLDGADSVSSYQQEFPANVLGMVTTRVVSTDSLCPFRADVVLLLDNGKILLEPCFGGVPYMEPIVGDMPIAADPSNVQLLAAPAAAVANGVTPFYLVIANASTSSDRLWQSHVQQGALTWNRVMLPLSILKLEKLSLARLYSGPDAEPGIWTLVHGSRVLYMSEDFGCHTDSTIICPSSTGYNSHSKGWACAPGHVGSPYMADGLLCGGGADGFFLDRPADEAPFSRPGHQCKRCPQANCLSCNAEGCLLCHFNFHPQIPSAAGGATTCVSSCSPGFSLVAGVCRPSSPPLPNIHWALPAPFAFLGLDPGDRITALGESWLSVDTHTGQPVIPAVDDVRGPGPRVLLFTEQRRTYIMAASDVGQPGQPTFRPVSLLDPHPAAPTIGFAELGPFVFGGSVVYMVALCGASGASQIVSLKCSGPVAPCVPSSRASQSVPGGGYSQARRLSSTSAIMPIGHDEMTVIRVDPPAEEARFLLLPATGAVSLPAKVEAGTRARPDFGDWLVWTTQLTKATAVPLSLLNNDPRMNALAGLFMSSLPNTGNSYMPVTIPRGRGSGLVELVFVQVAGTEWHIIRSPGDMLPSGRSVDLASQRHALGSFPRDLPPNNQGILNIVLQGVELTSGSSTYPSALLLITRTFVGVSLLHCPGGATGSCVLLPATFAVLPPEYSPPQGTRTWLQAVVKPGAGLASQDSGALPAGIVLDLLTFSMETGPVSLSLALLCPPGTAGSGCGACHETCTECDRPADSGACSACQPGMALFNGMCLSQCPAGTWTDVNTCRACPVLCDSCQSGDSCTGCVAQHFLAPGGLCTACHGSCAECEDASSCLSCQPGLVFLGADVQLLALPTGASPTRCVPACPAGYHTTASGCSPCGSHCASCPASEASCAQCERGWLLASPECVSSCPGGSLTLGNVCITCHGTCASCFGHGPSQCLSCRPGAPLLVDGACLDACPVGTFQQGQACLPCSDACASCVEPGPSECSTCPGNRVLLSGSCIAGCADGFFVEGGICLECHAACAMCADGRTCTRCKGSALVGPTGACVSTCPVGWRACPDSGQCLACPAHCVECMSADGACTGVCTSCEEGFVLASGQCREQCPIGEFLRPGADTCQPCDAPCHTCIGVANRCTSCASGLLRPEEGTCVSACPAAEAPVEGACLKCFAGCDQCEAGVGQPGCRSLGGHLADCPEIISCKACSPGLLLLGGNTCVDGCPTGHYADVEGWPHGCVPCHPSCAGSCAGAGVDGCVSPSGPGSSRVGLAVGLALGLLLLLILLILVVLCLIRRRRQRGGALGKAPHDEDATMLNTIVELALPGAILVGVDTDFRPLDEQLGTGTQASVYAAQAVGTGIMARLGSSMMWILQDDMVFLGYQQADMLSDIPEVRWGTFFRLPSQKFSVGAPGQIQSPSYMLLPVEGDPLPELVWHNSSIVSLFTSSHQFSLPAPGIELLAGFALEAGRVVLLGQTKAIDTFRRLYTVILGPTGHTADEFLPEMMWTDHLVTVGWMWSFYVAHQRDILHLFYDGGLRLEVHRLELPADALDLVATRLVSPAESCPGWSDLVVLTAEGTLEVFLCLGPESPRSIVSERLPSGTHLAGARLLAPRADALALDPGPLYLIAPHSLQQADRLWKLLIKDQILSWQRLILPDAGLRDMGSGFPELLRLRVVADHPPIWTLVLNRHVLFEAEHFACASDDTIDCGSSASGSSADGWSCVGSRAGSPFVASEQLCPGCANGYFLDRQSGGGTSPSGSQACIPCHQANCDTCFKSNCLVCAPGFLLEARPDDGTTVCVATCSAGLVGMEGSCRPVDSLQLAGRVGAWEMDLAPGEVITALASTRLLVDDSSGQLILPAAGSASGLLAFSTSAKALFWMANQPGFSIAAPARRVLSFTPPLMHEIVHLAEVGPFSMGSQRSHLLVMCDKNQEVFLGWLVCSMAESCTPGPVASLLSPGLADCVGVRQISVDVILIDRADGQLTFLQAQPATRTHVLWATSGAGAVVLSARGTSRADRAPEDWLVWGSLHGKVTASPIALALEGSASDSRLAVRDEGFLAGSSSNDAGLMPVLLPRPGSIPELVFSQVFGVDWIVRHTPGDLLPAGRSTQLPFFQEHLGTLPEEISPAAAIGPSILLQGLALEGGDPHFPSILLMLTRTFIGASVLHCPGGVFGPCALQPASFIVLPVSRQIPESSPFWSPAIEQLPAARSAGGSMHSASTSQLPEVLLFAPDTGAMVLSLSASCPAGQFGIPCQN